MPTTELQPPTPETVLAALTQERLLDLSRVFGLGLRSGRDISARMTARMGHQLDGRLPAVLRELGRDELRAACRRHGLPDDGRSRAELQSRLLAAAGLDPAALAPPARVYRVGDLPAPGQVVQARHRQWMVEAVHPGGDGDSARVCLVCLDDDAPGRGLDLLWDLEVGARVVDPATHGLDPRGRLDPPGHFGAYLHALEWSAVSAADPNRFQAPFRAGIKLMAHQLTPLMKALELPRANLFIADDVGLGKTIEAGLVLQELILRQQAELVLVACPAAICLQWRDEMQRRFGLRFEVMTHAFVAQRRQERGFGINPWATHNRFIISHQLLRRPEYRDPLLAHLGPRARKSLLILDEAHVAAPASRSRYAVDSDTTTTIRDLAPRFDNRLFLSATPHNGHSNSFSALLEILDPVRFTRGVPITGAHELAPVMVRRLKRDLRQLGVERFPRRILVQLALTHPGGAGNDDPGSDDPGNDNHEDTGAWTAAETLYDAETREYSAGATTEVGAAPATELRLAELLARYTKLSLPGAKRGRARLTFIRLQQRLLSSPEAFARSLEVHARAVIERGRAALSAGSARPKVDLDPTSDPELYGDDDDSDEAQTALALAQASATLPAPAEQARALLAEMRALAEQARRRPDAKVLALLAWMRAHQCPAVGADLDPGPGAAASARGRAWSERRIIIFTEWGDTKRYLMELLGQAVAHTERGDERILVFHGGMGDDARDEVQRAFNAPPDEHPVRVLIATDAAREGINLQAHCADLFHFDLPWNPARLEQRNGRIDRTLQTAPEVRCHYFLYPQRPEDRVLDTLVSKVETVQQELGSLGAVLLGEIEATLEENGIDDTTQTRLDGIGADANTAAVERELEAQRKDLSQLGEEVARAGARLDASAKALQVDPDSLRGVVEVGLRMAGATDTDPASQHRPDGADSPDAGALLRSAGTTRDGRPVYTLPVLDRSWDRTLDSLRPPRERDEALWEWRRRPPRPVSFSPIERLSEEVQQLHLAHPLVKRILDRFLAQGFSAHDLSRVTAVVAPGSVARVVAYARLSLFGPGAARLHDEIIAVAAPWPRSDDPAAPYKDPVTAAKAIESVARLCARSAAAPPAVVQERVAARAAAVFSDLWPSLEDEADARAQTAKNGLAQRARREADELRALLQRQKRAIDKQAGVIAQLDLFPSASSKTEREQQRQLELDRAHLAARLAAIDAEMETEPRAIEALYEVRMTRLAPVGLAVSWPESMT
ncbi:DISARM system SNF2-like helicase DrmD [Haliangium sp.]